MAEHTPELSWGHININVRDLDRSIAFYRLLGFEMFMPAIPYLALDMAPEAKPLPAEAANALDIAEGTRGRACIMQLGGGFPKIDLTEWNTPSPDAAPRRPPLDNGDTGLVRLCLGTEDLPGSVAHLMAQGVEFLSAPQEGHAGLADIALCKDPDGTLIELLQVYLDRWQALLQPG